MEQRNFPLLKKSNYRYLTVTLWQQSLIFLFIYTNSMPKIADRLFWGGSNTGLFHFWTEIASILQTSYMTSFSIKLFSPTFCVHFFLVCPKYKFSYNEDDADKEIDGLPSSISLSASSSIPYFFYIDQIYNFYRFHQ